MKTRVLTFLVLGLTIVFSACSTGNTTQKASKALAETSCLLFDESIEPTAIPDQTKEILEQYGFETNSDIDTYIESIAGTSEENQLIVMTREHLELSCKEALDAAGISAAELSQALVQE
jgi:hypothetical protein